MTGQERRKVGGRKCKRGERRKHEKNKKEKEGEKGKVIRGRKRWRG